MEGAGGAMTMKQSKMTKNLRTSLQKFPDYNSLNSLSLSLSPLFFAFVIIEVAL